MKTTAKQLYDDTVEICKEINSYLKKVYILYDGEHFLSNVEFNFENVFGEGISLKTSPNAYWSYLHKDECSVFGCRSYLHEVQKARKGILKLKLIEPKSAISVKKLLVR